MTHAEVNHHPTEDSPPPHRTTTLLVCQSVTLRIHIYYIMHPICIDHLLAIELAKKLCHYHSQRIRSITMFKKNIDHVFHSLHCYKPHSTLPNRLCFRGGFKVWSLLGFSGEYMEASELASRGCVGARPHPPAPRTAHRSARCHHHAA